MTLHYQNYTFRNEASQARMVKVMELLKLPHTRDELAEALSISKNAMHAYLLALMTEAPRKIHIHDWRRNSPGSPTPIYLVGDLPNKRRPMVMSNAQKKRKSRANNPERALDEIHAKRAARAKVQRDPLTAALFGKA
jgi:predicted ArsR family transcriptional regulator